VTVGAARGNLLTVILRVQLRARMRQVFEYVLDSSKLFGVFKFFVELINSEVAGGRLHVFGIFRVKRGGLFAARELGLVHRLVKLRRVSLLLLLNFLRLELVANLGGDVAVAAIKRNRSVSHFTNLLVRFLDLFLNPVFFLVKNLHLKLDVLLFQLSLKLLKQVLLLLLIQILRLGKQF